MIQRLVLLAAIAACAATAAFAQPAQDPLLLRGTQVTPNVMYTLDDSPSMRSMYVPTDLKVAVHPADIGTDDGAVATTATGFVQQMRSSTTNPLYYDPAVRYLPWALSNGSLMPSADPKSTWLNPHPSTPTGGTVDLTINAAVKASWCETGSGAACTVTTLNFVPAMYYRYKGAGSTADLVNFDRVEILAAGSFPKGPARTDCAGTTCTQAEELQNFANWFAYHRTRRHVAIAGTTLAFSKLPDNARIGYGALNAWPKTSAGVSIDGGASQYTIVKGIREFKGTDRQAFFNWIYTLKTSGYTPTKRAVVEVGQYFQRADHRGPWSAQPGIGDSSAHLSCRKNFHVLVSDGFWNNSDWAFSDVNSPWNQDYDAVEGPQHAPVRGTPFHYTPVKPYRSSAKYIEDNGWSTNMLADLSLYFWSRDLRPDLPNDVEPTAANPAYWQHLVHYTVGLGVKGILKPEDWPALQQPTGGKDWSNNRIDDLWHTAVNSRGEYLSANRGAEFANRLSAIFASINASASTAGVSVSGKRLAAGARKYVPEFTVGDWSGELYAYSLDAEGVAADQPAWRASQKVPPHALRRIMFGAQDGSTKEFRWPELSPAEQALLGTEDTLQFLRGDRQFEGTKFRTRASTLGDIVNSAPLHVKDGFDHEYDFLPAGTPGQSDYRRFLGSLKARQGALYVGANDGMLHVLADSGTSAASDGAEAFAYVPRAAMATISKLAAKDYLHQYYVDGPISEHHAHLGGWKSLVLATGGAGVRSVFAVEASTPSALTATHVLWELNDADDPDIGHVTTAVASGVTKGGKWVAVFGNGLFSANRKGVLFVVDLASGKVVRKLEVPGLANGLGGVRLVTNLQREIMAAYAGDALGRVWKFDLAGDTPTKWRIALDERPLFAARSADGTPQPITAAPQYIPHPRGGNLVIVGTGKLIETADVTSTGTQSIYGLWDRTIGPRAGQGIAGREELLVQTHQATTQGAGADAGSTYHEISSNKADWSVHSGWLLDLGVQAGQRVVYPLDFVSGRVKVESIFVKGGIEKCDVQQQGGVNYFLDPMTGGMSTKSSFDANFDGTIDHLDKFGAYSTGADGEDSIVTTAGGRTKVISTKKSPRLIAPLEVPVKRTWRQIFPKLK